ncbi:hypothetical protein GCM10028824_06930 [Hymenobacter segetis]|uniref:M23 family metallopeptidase n=1 Tax=Hymenobacter segetis TaxID=2025509 RepID=A0ABU9M1A4_9BACT
MPYTVALNAKLVHMTSSVVLPAKIVVYPGKQSVLLARLTPEPNQTSSFRYDCPYQIGAYTGLQPDTSYVYALPFKRRTGEQMPNCNTNNKDLPGNPHPYFFSLAKGTPIHASRAGIVASIRQDLKGNKGPKANYIIVYHADGSYAWYQNLKHESVAVRIGQQVAEGDLLSYYGGTKQNAGFYFTVEYPGAIYPIAVPAVFRVDDKIVRFH